MRNNCQACQRLLDAGYGRHLCAAHEVPLPVESLAAAAAAAPRALGWW